MFQGSLSRKRTASSTVDGCDSFSSGAPPPHNLQANQRSSLEKDILIDVLHILSIFRVTFWLRSAKKSSEACRISTSPPSWALPAINLSQNGSRVRTYNFLRPFRCLQFNRATTWRLAAVACLFNFLSWCNERGALSAPAGSSVSISSYQCHFLRL